MNQPKSVRSGEELPLPELSLYLINHGIITTPILAQKQFAGGYSNLTYQLETDQGPLILRKGPKGAEKIKGGHDMVREFGILHRLQTANFEFIPTPLHVCEDIHVLGSPFYVMRRVEGTIYRGGQPMNIPPERMRVLSERLCDTLVALHQLDLTSSGLITLGKPSGFVARQVEGWTRRYAAAQTENIEAMQILSTWLQEHIPPAQAPVLLHNDFKFDNVVFSDEDQVRALLDWEMATIGDPLVDVGVALSYWAEAGDSAFEKHFNMTWLPGNLTRVEFAHRYAERSGRDISHLPFYYVFGLFKNAVVMQQIFARYQAGLTQDPRFAQLGEGVKRFSKKGLKTIEAGEIR